MNISSKDSGKTPPSPERFTNILNAGLEIMGKVQKEFENSDFADIFSGAGLPGSVGFKPAVEIKDAQDARVFCMDLPGVKKADVSVTAAAEVLTISGSRVKPTGTPEHSELTYGTFERKFNIPRTSRPKEVTASFKEGVLTVTVPCVHEDGPSGPQNVTIS